MRDLSSVRARGPVIQVIMVVLHPGIEVTQGEVTTLRLAELFMLLCVRLELIMLGLTPLARHILLRVHLLDPEVAEGILVIRVPLIILLLVGAVLNVVIWDIL